MITVFSFIVLMNKNTTANEMDPQVLALSIRRRQVAVRAAVLAVLSIQRRRLRRGTTIRRPIFNFAVFIRGLRPTFFARMYRMPREVFFRLADTICTGYRSKSFKSCPLMRLSITLRWLGGGSYLDIAVGHQVSISSVYSHIDNTIQAMDEVFQLRFPYHDRDWLARSSRGFSRNERSPLTGCCAALDGKAIKINEPALRDVPNSSAYYNTKGFFALNIQALCDSSYKFLYISALSPGSTHDSTALAMS